MPLLFLPLCCEREERGNSGERETRAAFFFFSSLDSLDSDLTLPTTELISSPLFFPVFPSARKGKMVRLIACSFSNDATPSVLRPGREKAKRDEKGQRRGEGGRRAISCLEPPLFLCLFAYRAPSRARAAASTFQALFCPVLAFSRALPSRDGTIAISIAPWRGWKG